MKLFCLTLVSLFFAFGCSHAPTKSKTAEFSGKMKKERGLASEAGIQGASIKAWYLMVGDILPGGPELNCAEGDAHMLACKRDAEASAIELCGGSSNGCLVDPSQTKVLHNGVITSTMAQQYFSQEIVDQIINANDRTTHGCICTGMAFHRR